METQEPSHFLSSERSSQEEIKKSFNIIKNLPYIKIVIDAISNIALVIDSNRQIVFANKKLMSTLGSKDLEKVLGLRPGELLNCKHSINKFGGCGTNDACKYCGAALSIKQSIEEAIASENECRITVEKQGKMSSLDLLVTASPIKMENQLYIILSIADISNDKRRKILERVFFHDIVNTAGGLKGILEYLDEEPDDAESTELISLALHSAGQLLEDILLQRTLVAAENGELVVKKTETLPAEIISEVSDLMSKHDVAKGITINQNADSKNDSFITDPVILRRILTNLLKNALEATNEGDSVKIGFTRKDKEILFFVQNNTILSEEVRMQIFQRSFSTKGNNRGIGTYSIKLLTETYLEGKVNFSSQPPEGTIFTVTLPVGPEK